MLSPARLIALLEVSRTGSISAAAKQLQLTPSAVSSQISTLEQALDTKLIERGARGVWLTSAGARLVEYSESIVGLMERAELETRELGRGDTGRLSLGFFASAGTHLVPMALSSFMAMRPTVSLNLSPGQPNELLPRLLSTELDVAVVFEYTAGAQRPTGSEAGSNLTRETLLIDPYFLAVPPGYRAKAPGPIPMSELTDAQWIATQGLRSEPALVDRLSAIAGFSPQVRCRTDYYDIALGMVAAGIGFALVPGLSLGPGRDLESRGVQLRTLDTPTPITRVVTAVTRTDNPNPLVPAFLDRLRISAARVHDSFSDLEKRCL
jgi:molybdate transport repressor ModE-like protein